jgi:phosphoribosylamine--glycine ligase
MNVLIIGSGAREHALGWKIKQSPLLNELFFLPGNPGTSELGINLPGTIEDFKNIGDAIFANRIGMVVVGPEMPLVNGIRDEIESDPRFRNVKIIGPGREGAKLEGSKDFAKQFMHRYHIPTAPYSSFTRETLSDGCRFLGSLEPPYVLKADGPAAGKGVIIVHDREEAERTLAEMTGGKFGKSSETVVVEKYLHGIELSVFILTDGNDYVMLPEAKDYKRAGVNDTGLNTGGMGSVSPVPFADGCFMEKVKTRIIEPTLAGLKAEGIRYTGFIFFGLINCNSDPFVIEYNVRMGDPETEAVMPRIKSDLLSLLDAAACGTIGDQSLEIEHLRAATVMLVSGGYPGEFKKGFPITGCGNVTDSILFHAGTKMERGTLTTSGGRVLAVTSTGATPSDALRKCYNSVSLIDFEGKYFRPDIGFDLA